MPALPQIIHGLNMNAGGAPAPEVVEAFSGGWYGPPLKRKPKRRIEVQPSDYAEQVPEAARKTIQKLARRNLPTFNVLALLRVELGYQPPPAYEAYLSFLLNLRERDETEFFELLPLILDS